MSDLLIVTGACGTGKSSIISLLKQQLSEEYRVYDFDDYGVPDNPTIAWRKEATQYWLSVAAKNKTMGVKTVITGLCLPEDVEDNNELDIRFCLLDIDEPTRKKRLRMRGAAEELIKDVEELEGLRKWVPESAFAYKVINTTNLTIEEVASKVINYCLQQS